MISGKPADAGSILDIENGTALTLISLSKAIEHKAETAPAEEAPPSCPPKKPTPKKRTKE